MNLPTFFDKRRRFSDKDKSKIKHLYAQGYTITHIAKRYKANHSSIQYILHPQSTTWRYPKGVKRIIKTHRSGKIKRLPTQKDFILKDRLDRRRKLTETQRTQIKHRSKSGWTITQLAKHFHVSQTTIKCVINPTYKAHKLAKDRVYMASHRKPRHLLAKTQAEYCIYKRSILKRLFS